jgi:general nucleoside transport system permease protein
VTERLRGVAVPLGVNLVVLGLAVLLSMAVIELSGKSSIDASKAMWDGAWGQRAAVGGTLSKTIPLVLVALGWIVAYGARRVNIGFEGQILIGGVFATWVGLKVTGLPMAVHLPLAVAAGVVGGALWAGVAAWLWARRGVNEIISTLLLNFVAIEIVSWLVRGPFQEATGTFPRSGAIAQSARWPKLMERTALGWDLLLAAAVVALIAVLVARTTFGFKLRFTGANEEAARHGGVNTRLVSVAALVISGGLAGLAGSSLILGGESPSMSDNFSANLGFTGIVVALLARNNPIGAIPAALLFATLRQGGGLAEARVGVSSSVVLITQALVIVFVAAAAFILDRRRSVRVDAPGGPTVSQPAEHPTPQATVA